MQIADPVIQHVGLVGLSVGGVAMLAAYLLEYRVDLDYPPPYPMTFALVGFAFALASVPQLAPRFAGGPALALFGYFAGVVSLTALFCYLIWRWPTDHPLARR